MRFGILSSAQLRKHFFLFTPQDEEEAKRTHGRVNCVALLRCNILTSFLFPSSYAQRVMMASSSSDVRPEEEDSRTFEVKKHSAFWLRHLRLLPTPYTSADVQRMTLAYFCLGALDLLGLLDDKVKSDERQEYVDWIYGQQLDQHDGGGFLPGPHFSRSQGAKGHLAMTYTAVLNLAILRDDFTRLDVDGVRTLLRTLQQPDGSFAPSEGQAEFDCRFVYCAFAVCALVGVWEAIDVKRAVHFLMASRSYDGAFGQAPGQESHGGSTYCALAALALCGQLHEALGEEGVERIRQWLIHRQQDQHGGMNGRLEKPEDACYSFWCGASLAILETHSDVDAQADVRWLLSCQSKVGGIAKMPDEVPDVMHSYLSLAALSMHAHDEEGSQQHLRSSLKQLDPALNISLDSLAHLRKSLPTRNGSRTAV